MKKVISRRALAVVAGIFFAGSVMALVAVFAFGSGSASATPSQPVVETNVAPVPTATVAAPPTETPAPTATAIPSPTPLPTATPAPTATPLPTPTLPPKDAVDLGLIVVPSDPGKTNGRWIDLNLSDGVTRLVQGRTVIMELPSAWGYGTPGTGDDYYSTPPGLYFVYEKRDELHHDETWSTGYFRGWVGFDPERANGYHSFILDEKEQVIDARLGPVSHGCVRVWDWQALYNFAEVGMPVMIHGEYRPPVLRGKD